MTDRKHLKRRVRERMARTGESYMTALRHVLAARDTAGDAAPAPGGHHDMSLLRHALPRFSEAMLLGLGGGIGFMYAVFEYRGRHPAMTVVAQAHPEPMIPRALARAGVVHHIARTGSPRVAERELRETLDTGGLAVCRVGRFALPWRPGLPFPDPLEVAVPGIDGDEVLVLDTRPEPERLPLTAFMAAWSSLKKEKHHLVSLPAVMPALHGRPAPGRAEGARDDSGAGVRSDLDVAVREAIRETADRLTGPVLGNAFDVNFGLSGMRRLAAQLADRRGGTGWARRFADPRAFHTALTRLHECLEVEYTAPGATRPLYAAFLDEAAGLLGGTACREAAGLYRRAGQAWAGVAARAVAGLPAYRALAEEKAELLLTRGSLAADRLRSIAAEDSFEGPLDEAARTATLDDLAALAADAVRVEEEAVRALRAI